MQKLLKFNKLHLLILLIIAIGIMAFAENKPKILIIGDSISLSYTPFVQQYFANDAIIQHNPGNARHTAYGLKKIEEWIGDGAWDIVLFNWGVHDLCYRNPASNNPGNRDKVDVKITNTIEQYTSNLDSIVSIMKQKTNAKLVFVTTSYVPENEHGRFTDDAIKYNEAAKKIMKAHSIPVYDIYQESIPIHNAFGLGSDDVHYTKEGKEKLSELIIEKLKEIIAARD